MKLLHEKPRKLVTIAFQLPPDRGLDLDVLARHEGWKDRHAFARALLLEALRLIPRTEATLIDIDPSARIELFKLGQDVALSLDAFREANGDVRAYHRGLKRKIRGVGGDSCWYPGCHAPASSSAVKRTRRKKK